MLLGKVDCVDAVDGCSGVAFGGSLRDAVLSAGRPLVFAAGDSITDQSSRAMMYVWMTDVWEKLSACKA